MLPHCFSWNAIWKRDDDFRGFFYVDLPRSIFVFNLPHLFQWYKVHQCKFQHLLGRILWLVPLRSLFSISIGWTPILSSFGNLVHHTRFAGCPPVKSIQSSFLEYGMDKPSVNCNRKSRDRNSRKNLNSGKECWARYSNRGPPIPTTDALDHSTVVVPHDFRVWFWEHENPGLTRNYCENLH